MVIYTIIFLVILLTTLVSGYLFYKWRLQPPVGVSRSDFFKLLGSGILAFVSDTLGVGSFAVNIALAKVFGTFADEELPAMCNTAQLIPGAIESLFFMKYVEVDLTTLVTLVAGTCIGGLLGGNIVSRMSKQAIRVAMMLCFSLIIMLLIGNQLELLPVGGTAMALHSWKLLFGFLGLVACGALTSVGIGLFALVQGILFLLSVSPLVAFPIMMTAGAMQQPLTTFMFLRQSSKIPLKRTLILSLGGCIGVLVTLPVFNYVTVGWLHGLLLFILCYNLIAISRAFFQTRVARVTTIAEA